MRPIKKYSKELFDNLDTDSDGILTINDIINHAELTKLHLSKDEGICLI